ncbi:MAG: MBL fold metallo-hydrolase [Pseudomonadota bacterium]
MHSHEKVSDGVFRIRGKRSNIYLLAGASLVLVDTGMPGDGEGILRAIQELGYAPAAVQYVFITHGHLDHVGSLAAVKAASNAKVIASINEKEYVEGRKMLCSMSREGLGGKAFRIILFFMEKFLQKYEPARVDLPFSGDSVATAAGMSIIETPGHSAGSLSFYHQEKKILFSGDALSGSPSLRLPVKAGCSDYARALQSVQCIGELDFELCLFGHGEPLIGRAAKKVKALL